LDDIRRHTTIQQRLPFIRCTSRMDFPVADVTGPTSSLRALEEDSFCRTGIWPPS